MSNIRGQMRSREEPIERRLPKEEEGWHTPPPFHDWVVPETPEPKIPDEAGQIDGEDDGEVPLNGNEYPDGELDGSGNVDDGEIVEDGGAIDGHEDTMDGDAAEIEEESLSEDDTKLSNFARIGYVIGISPSTGQEQHTSLATYVSDLEASMDRLAVQIGETMDVEVHLPSIVDSILGTDCPPSVDPLDTCKHIEAMVGVRDVETTLEATSGEFRIELISAIEDQELQKKLDIVNPKSNVYIITGAISETEIPKDTSDGTISGNFVVIDSQKDSNGVKKGAIVGMAAAGFCILLCLVAIVLHRRRHRWRYDEKNATSSKEGTDVEEGHDPDSPTASSGEGSLHEGCKVAENNIGNIMDDVSSMASSSICFGAYSPNAVASIPKHPGDDFRRIILSQGSRDIADLDDAIRNGDWATTGDTAAILAEESSYATSAGMSLGPSMQPMINADRVAELDKWIEDGNWEEIVNAASRYDNDKSSISSSYLPDGLKSSTFDSANVDDDTESKISSASKVSLVSIVESIHSVLGDSRSVIVIGGSAGPVGSDRKQEIRNEIEILVREVLPEEIESIEELMVHFEGKEEELLLTVKTMQNRFAKQRSRLSRKTPPPTVFASRSVAQIQTQCRKAQPALGPCLDDDQESPSIRSCEFGLDQALAPSSANVASS